MDIAGAERKRFLSLLEIVRREGDWLLKTDARLFKTNINAHVSVQLLVAAYNAINLYARSRIPATTWPDLLPQKPCA